MSTPNLDSRYITPSGVDTKIAAQATADAGQYLSKSAPILTTRNSQTGLRDFLSVKDYGASGTAQQANDAVISSTSGNAVVTTSLATIATVGNYAQITGAGTSGGPLLSQISAVNTSAGTITLSTAATTIVNAVSITVGPDDRPAFQSAMSAAMSTITTTGFGVTVFIPFGNYFFATGNTIFGFGCGIPITRGLPARLQVTGHGRGSTRLILSAKCINAFYLNRVGDYDTFQNITLENFDVDNNGVYDAVNGTGNHVLIGSLPSNSTFQNRLNYNNISIRRIGGVGLPSLGSNSKANQHFIALIGAQTSTGEATQTSVTNILVEDVEVVGGNGLANICTFGAGTTPGFNVYYDSIRIRGCRHTQTAYPVTNASQTSYFICGSGFGDYGEIVDCYSSGIADDGVEIGAMQHVLLDRVRIDDPFWYGFTFRHTHQPTDVNAQRIIVRDCYVRATATGSAALGSSANTASRAFCAYIADGTNTMGNFIFERCSYESTNDAQLVTGYSYPVMQVTGPVKSVEIHALKARFTNYTANPSSASNFYPVYINSTFSPTRVIIRGYHLRIDGMTLPSGGTFFSALAINASGGGTADVDIENVTAEVGTLTFTGGGSANFIVLGGSGLIKGTIRGLRNLSGSTSVGAKGINITNTAATAGLLVIENCDLSSFFFNNGSDFVIASQRQIYTRIRHTIWKNTPVPGSITPTGTVYTYQNLDSFDELVTVSSGTVTAISTSDAAGNNIATGLTQGAFYLQPGWKLAVTYSVVPTMTKTPMY